MIWLFASSSSIARFSGFTLFGLDLVFWFAKDVTDANIQRNLGIANLAISLVGLAVALYATMPRNAVIRTNVWVLVLPFFLGGFTYGFMIFLKRRTAQR